MDSKKSSLDWSYRAEGNCSLVAYNKKTKRVYRVLKVHKTCAPQISDSEPIQRHYARLVQYAACVVERLYGAYMAIPMLQNQSVGFLKSLSSLVQANRPDKRHDKSICLSPYVLSMPDYAFLPSSVVGMDLPSLMFEFKPGSVVRRYSDCHPFISCSLIKSCYSCLNKELECQAPGKRMSRFCPQELFSGNAKRMKRCIVNLLEDINCTRNKLRFFKNGIDQTKHMQDVYDMLSLMEPYFSSSSDQNTRVSQLSDVLLACLTHRKSSKKRSHSPYTTHQQTHDNYSGVVCSSEYTSLPQGCVLSVLRTAQQFGISSLSEVENAYHYLMSCLDEDPSLEQVLCINGPYDTGMWRLSSQPSTPAGVSPQLMSAFLVVRNYLIYRTVKDSSVLVTIQPLPRKWECLQRNDQIFTVIDATGQPYICSASIIDLDPKPLSKMATYIAHEKEVAALYKH